MILGAHPADEAVQPRSAGSILGAPAAKGAVAPSAMPEGVLGKPANANQVAASWGLETPRDGLYRGRVVWVFCFCSFLALQLNQSYGTVAAALFLAPWLALFTRRIPLLVKSVAKDWLLLVPPSFATISAIWSSDPNWTMRTGIQYGATMIIGIAAARLVDRRIILTSLLMALATVTLASLVLVVRYGGFAGMHGVAGLYGAKNQFASSSAVLFIGAAYLMKFARRSFVEKVMAFGLMGVAMLGIYCGHSAGTLVSLFGVAMLVLTFHMLRKGGTIAILGVITLFFAMPVPIILVGSDTIFARILKALGKDSTLTGRTDLWDTAFQQIQSHLLLGGGYQAFWRIGNAPAEKLWAMFGITNKTGFNFHNEYINTTVDLGLIGLLIIITVLFCVASSSLKIRWRHPEGLLSAFHTIFFFYLFLTFVEAEFFYQFFLSPIILCIAWSDRALARQPIARHAVATAPASASGPAAAPKPLPEPDPAPDLPPATPGGAIRASARDFLLGRRVQAERST
ncbi:MAG TPA: O-antigen ligase family protein [Dongiaceae bacterium]|nr:O-antigen ligase family protein [Dongiaceae bacterium]